MAIQEDAIKEVKKSKLDPEAIVIYCFNKFSQVIDENCELMSNGSRRELKAKLGIE